MNPTAQSLNTLACRAIASMRTTKSDRWKFCRQGEISRPQKHPYNDRLQLYWGDFHVATIARPGCGQDWQIVALYGFHYLQLFFEAWEQFRREAA